LPASFFFTQGGDALNGDCWTKPLLREDRTGANALNLYSERGSNTVVASVVWEDFKPEGDHDDCGDIVFPEGGSGVLQNVNLATDLTLPCVDRNDNAAMDFSICFSWREPGDDDRCDPKFLFPGTPSKCVCARYDIPQMAVLRPQVKLDDC
jgi:hypothetical protein